MTVPPQLPPAEVGYQAAVSDQDVEQLRTLSIFWYILAGLHLLVAAIPLLWLVGGLFFMVIGLVFGGAAATATHEPGVALVGIPYMGMGLFISCMGLFAILCFGALSYFEFTCARSLVQQRRLTLCQVMASITCLFFPLGTILGVFTLVVLSRASVRVRFS